MNEITTSPEFRLQALYKKFKVDIGVNNQLSEINELSLNRFNSLKFPGKKDEKFTYIKSRDLTSLRYEPFCHPYPEVDREYIKKNILPGCEKSVIVIVDGIYNRELSNVSVFCESLRINTFVDALNDHSIKERLLHTIKNENDVFASINGLFINEGLILEVGAYLQNKTPLQILHYSSGTNIRSYQSTPRIIYYIGKNVELTILEKYVGVTGESFVNTVKDMVLSEKACVRFHHIQAESGDSNHFSKTRVSLDKNSYLKATNILSGGNMVRHNFEGILKGEGAEIELNSLSILNGSEQAHNYVSIIHEAPNCISKQRFRNILNGKSRASVDSCVTVKKGATGSNSDLLINNLVLSDQSRVHSKPGLMIYNDDVKCSHGSTVGQIDKDQLLYLQTRGMSEPEALTLLVKGFAKMIINLIECRSLVDEINNTLLGSTDRNFYLNI